MPHLILDALSDAVHSQSVTSIQSPRVRSALAVSQPELVYGKSALDKPGVPFKCLGRLDHAVERE